MNDYIALSKQRRHENISGSGNRNRS